MIHVFITNGTNGFYAQYQGMDKDVIEALNAKQGYTCRFVDEKEYFDGIEAVELLRQNRQV